MLAACVVALGAWAYDEKNKYFYKPVEDVYDILFDVSILLMVVGAVMFLVTMSGFVGALRENTLLIKVVSHLLNNSKCSAFKLLSFLNYSIAVLFGYLKYFV